MSFRFDIQSSNAVQGLYGAIDFHTTVKTDPYARLVFDSTLTVSTRTGTRGGGPAELGVARQLSPLEAHEWPRNGEMHFVHRLTLNPMVMDRVEEMRNGQPLDLECELTLLGFNREMVPKENQAFRETNTKHHRIEKSKWVEEFLPVLGFAGYEMWELRFPRQANPALLEAETTFLQAAIHDYNRGEYHDAYQDCRKMMESFRARAGELSLPEAVGAKEWGRAETYFSTALHERTGHGIVRADAEFAITLARAIHRRVAAALENPKGRKTTLQATG